MHSGNKALCFVLQILNVYPDARGTGAGKPAMLGGGGGRKPHTPNPISTAAKLEHAIVGQMLIDIIGPRLNQQVMIVMVS